VSWIQPLTTARERRLVAVVSLIFVLLALAPYVLHTFSSDFQGLTVIRDKDFANYDSRLERALKGHPSQASNGITPIEEGISGMQDAGLEQVVGTLFSWTGLDAVPLSVILSALATGFFTLLLHLFFRSLDFSAGSSFLMTSAYVIILFHVVSRVVHPGWSFLPVLGALMAAIAFSRRPTFLGAVVLGLLLAILPSVYFWGWSFVWCACAVSFFLTALFDHDRERCRRFRHLLPVVVGLLLLSLPVILRALTTLKGPLGEEVFTRASFIITRGVESPIRSLLLLMQSVLLLSLLPTFKKDASYRWASALLLGILLAMHQNLVHTKLLMFSSHFYPYVVLASLTAGGLVLRLPVDHVRRWIIAGISLLFLAGAAVDYLPGYRFLLPNDRTFADQHLMPAIAMLQEGERENVLTDLATGRLLTSWTDDGIVYGQHARFLMISDAQMAERYCLSELFAPVSPDPYRALYIEYNVVLDSQKMRQRERDLIHEACQRVRSAPWSYIQKYHVTHILWNGAERPNWNMSMYPEVQAHLMLRERGVEWALFELLS
jgi:hypothetical protein